MRPLLATHFNLKLLVWRSQGFLNLLLGWRWQFHNLKHCMSWSSHLLEDLWNKSVIFKYGSNDRKTRAASPVGLVTGWRGSLCFWLAAGGLWKKTILLGTGMDTEATPPPSVWESVPRARPVRVGRFYYTLQVSHEIILMSSYTVPVAAIGILDCGMASWPW